MVESSLQVKDGWRSEMQADCRLSGRDIAWAALLPAGLAVAYCGRQLSGLFAGGLINPDTYMRLVRLREMLQVHHRVDVVWNDSSGGGTLLHWSHLLDSLVCLLSLPLRCVVGLSAALHATALFVGPLFMAGLGVALVWAVLPFAPRRYLWPAVVLAAVAPPIRSYGLVGEVHHHVPTVIVAVVAAGWTARLIAGYAPPAAGLALGAWAGLGVWLTPESVPLTMASFGALWLVWASDAQRGDIAAAMRHAGAAFLATVAAAWLVDPPDAGYAAFAVDRISLVFVGAAAVAAAVGAATWPVDRICRIGGLRPASRLGVAAAAGAAGFVLWLACFPQLLRGSATMLSPADWHAMFDQIREMRPITRLGPILACLMPGALAAILLAWLAVRHRSPPLGYAALCTAALLLLGQRHIRFAAYPDAIAALLLPVAIDTLERLRPPARQTQRALARAGVIAGFLLLPYAGGLLGSAHAAGPAPASCSTAGLPAMLAPYAGQVVLADVNITPELLFRTRMRTVGSLYHRNAAAFMRLRAAWRSLPSQQVPPAVQRTDASLVLFCPHAQRSLLVADLPPHTLLDRLGQHRVPPWLRQVASDPLSGYMLYQVRQR